MHNLQRQQIHYNENFETICQIVLLCLFLISDVNHKVANTRLNEKMAVESVSPQPQNMA